jgi:hypothetical protein
MKILTKPVFFFVIGYALGWIYFRVFHIQIPIIVGVWAEETNQPITSDELSSPWCNANLYMQAVEHFSDGNTIVGNKYWNQICLHLGICNVVFWKSFMINWFWYTGMYDPNYFMIEYDETPYMAKEILNMWSSVVLLAIMTIWSRGVGPRFRPDQLSDLTWKDLLIFLLGAIILSTVYTQ